MSGRISERLLDESNRGSPSTSNDFEPDLSPNGYFARSISDVPVTEKRLPFQQPEGKVLITHTGRY
jgi:hypothetical protein